MMTQLTIHQKRSGNSMILAIVSSCSPREIFFGNANRRGKQRISTTQVQHMQQKGTYLLHLLSRDLSVCRMFRLPSCMLRKQSCITELNSATQKLKKWHANDHDLKIFSVTTLGSIKTSFYALQHTKRSVANDRN